jgi:hypothetical protein
MGSNVKVYVNNGQITRTADPLNNKFDGRIMKNRVLAAIGFFIIDLGIFATKVTFLPKSGSFGFSGPWSHFINSRARWDYAWGALVAAILISVGIFLLLEALGKFRKD